MLRRALASSRYIVVIPVIGTLLGSLVLLFYEAMVMILAVVNFVEEGSITAKSAKSAKVLAVGLIEAVDVFLIAIVMYIMSLGLYSLFVDDTLPLPRWLAIRDLEDLKNHLIGVVIAVLGVLFLREAVAWDGNRDLLGFGVALALVIAALAYYLTKLRASKD
ncbi:MAG TPA: YqhA family protein [Casimicrobiaceae bacterium]|nr:YqhA family protein [Casimicrobiaceae bacterium]